MTVGPLSVAVTHGAVFDYFDEVRKALGAAQIELFFVDPYLDSEFVSRYLTQIPACHCPRSSGFGGKIILQY